MQIAPLHEFVGCRNSVFYTPLWPESITVAAEFSLADWFHDLLNTLLYQPVPDAGYSQRSGGTIRFWDFLSSYRFGPIAMFCALDNESNFLYHFVSR